MYICNIYCRFGLRFAYNLRECGAVRISYGCLRCCERLVARIGMAVQMLEGKEKMTATDQTIVLCHDCKNFLEYTKEYAQTVEGANGDCYIRLISGADKQFCACKYDDFCSYRKRKDGDEDVEA